MQKLSLLIYQAWVVEIQSVYRPQPDENFEMSSGAQASKAFCLDSVKVSVENRHLGYIHLCWRDMLVD